MISELGRDVIKAFEACMQALPGRPGLFTTYRDSAGVLTIGWGSTNLDVRGIHNWIVPGVVWSQQQCDDALEKDLQNVAQNVLNILHPVHPPQWQLDALISFEYNTGDLASSSIPKKLRAGEVDAAIETMLLYIHDREGHVLRGLQRRRECEAALMRNNLMGAATIADLHLQQPDLERLETAIASANPLPPPTEASPPAPVPAPPQPLPLPPVEPSPAPLPT